MGELLEDETFALASAHSSTPLIPMPTPPACDRVTRHYMPELVEADEGDWGRLPNSELQLFATKRPVVKTERRKNDVITSLWVIEKSIFAPRKTESDAKSFYETQKVKDRMFKKDWNYLTHMQRFPKFAARLAGIKRGAKEAPPAVVKALHDQGHKRVLRCIFTLGSSRSYVPEQVSRVRDLDER